MNLMHVLYWIWGATAVLVILGWAVGIISGLATHVSPLIDREEYLAKRGCLFSYAFIRLGVVLTLVAILVKFVIKYLL